MKGLLKYINIFIIILIISCSDEKTGEIKPTEKDIEEPTNIKEKPVKEPVTYEKDGILYAPSITTFSLESVDEPSSSTSSGVDYIEVDVDGNGFERYDNPLKFSDEGRHTIKFRAVDKVGNVEPLKTQVIVIDDTEPELICELSTKPVSDGVKDYVPSGTVITLDCDDALSGISLFQINVNKSGFVDYTSPITLTDDGPYSIQYSACDNVGNSCEVKRIEVVCDGTKPVVDIKPSGKLYELGEFLIAPSSHEYYLSASDNGSGVAEFVYSLDGAVYVPYKSPLNVTSPGKHTITTYAVDRAGNKSDAMTLTFYVDPFYPKTNLKALIP